MKLTPLAGYVLIEAIDEQETTASGLVMPEKAKEKPAKGKVIRVGDELKPNECPYCKINNSQSDYMQDKFYPHSHENPDRNFINPGIKVGDTVVFHRWSGQDVKEGQKEYKLVKFSDLMGVYE